MLKVNNKSFDVDVGEILETLHILLSKENQTYFRQIKKVGKYYMTQCPYHKNGDEKKPSCGFHEETGFMHCFTCGEKKSFPEVIEYLLNEEPGFGLQWLSEKYNSTNYSNDRKVIKFDHFTKPKKSNIIKVEDISKYRMFHPYMFERKLTKDIIRRYDIGFDKSTNSITFPNKDEKGNILFIARRNINYKYFNYPTNAQKIIYGLYELKRDFPKANSVIICESMINCLTAVSYGKPAIALNGTGSASQLEKLAKLPYRTYYLGLDPDEAGQAGSDRIIKALKGKKIVKKLNIPEGKDINDLSKEEFDNLFIK